MEVQETKPTIYEEEGTKETAQSLNKKAGLRARSMAEQGKGQLTEKLETLARALRNASGQLREQESGKLIAGYIDTVSGKIEQASAYLNEKELRELLDAGKKVIRNRPALALAGIFATGFIVARVLKSAGRPAVSEWKKTGGSYV